MANQSGTAGANPQKTALQKATLKTIFGISIFQFALTYVERVSSDAVPLLINQFTNSAFLIYLIWSLNPLFNIINQPYVGWKGDHTWTRFGRRIPFMMIGVPLTAMFLILAPYSQNLVWPYLWAFIFICGYQFFNDVAWGAYQPLYGEMIPPHQRGLVSGVQQVFGSLAAFFCMFFGIGVLMGNKERIPAFFYKLPERVQSVMSPMFELPEKLPAHMKGFFGVFGLGGVLFIACLLILMVFIKEKKPDVLPEKTRFHLFGYYKEVFSSKQYITLVVLMVVLNVITTCIMATNTLFARNALEMDVSHVGFIISLDPLVVLALAFPVGIMADRFGRRFIMALSLVFTVCASVVGLTAQSGAGMAWLVALWGIGRTLQFVAFVPLIIDYIAPDRMGTFIGGTVQARGIAVFLVGPMNGAIVDLFRVPLGMGGQAYRVPYAMAIFFCVVAAFLLVKLGKSQYVEKT